MQRRQHEQCLAVVTRLGITDLATMVLQNLCRRSPHREPGLGRQLRPERRERGQSEAGRRLADHDDRGIPIKMAQRVELEVIQGQRLDVEQRQAAAGHTLFSECLCQRSAFFGRPGQKQAPGAHGWPASPYTALRMSSAPCLSRSSATWTPKASASDRDARAWAVSSLPPLGSPTRPRSHN
ncbi:hypothetical protein D3C77_429180 [compost metagenome]